MQMICITLPCFVGYLAFVPVISQPVRSHMNLLDVKVCRMKSHISLCPVPVLFHMPCSPYGTILRSIDASNRKRIILPVSLGLPSCTLIVCANTPIVSSTELRWPNQLSSMFTNTDRFLTTRQDIFSLPNEAVSRNPNFVVHYFTNISSLNLFFSPLS